MSAKWTTSYTCQKEFSNTFEVLSNTIIYLFCGYTVSWEYKVSITTYVNSKTYIKNKQVPLYLRIKVKEYNNTNYIKHS